MEERLVTVAIHTYERAIILKSILEAHGIEVALQNVNLIQPVISAGVRVRIKESDLPAALRIIEELNFSDENQEKTKKEETSKLVLVPVDFSDYSLKAARIAARFAKDVGGEVVLLNTYYSPFYTSGIPFSDAFAFDEHYEEVIQQQVKLNRERMDQLMATIQAEIKAGKLPEVPFQQKFREGVPEEQILLYSKKHHPMLIIMGSHGQGSKEGDLLGSVTADILERSRVPVFAFPENSSITSFSDIRSIAFITHFDQRDLVAFEVMMQLLKPYQFKVYFIHLTPDPDTWDEIQLNGIKAYFHKQYPEIESSYCMIRGEDLINGLNDFITERAIDVLAMTAQKRTIFSRLFNPSLARKMLFHSKTPILVIRG